MALSTKKRTFNTEETIDYLIKKIKTRFPSEFADVTFGDVGVYTPDMFRGPRGATLPIVSISPVYDRLVADSRTVASEVRARGVDVSTTVLVLEELQAKPPEQVGERLLVRKTQHLIDFLGEDQMTNLDGHVDYLALGDVSWDWIIGQDKQILRSSRISIIAFARLNRKPLT